MIKYYACNCFFYSSLIPLGIKEPPTKFLGKCFKTARKCFKTARIKVLYSKGMFVEALGYNRLHIKRLNCLAEDARMNCIKVLDTFLEDGENYFLLLFLCVDCRIAILKDLRKLSI